jgi:hypothetical protein
MIKKHSWRDYRDGFVGMDGHLYHGIGRIARFELDGEDDIDVTQSEATPPQRLVQPQ